MIRILALLLVVLLACTPETGREPTQTARDPLPSWNAGATKQAILEFVESVTDPAGDKFVVPDERVAVFDHDGTLWCEKPVYIHLFAILSRFRQLTDADPELAKRQPYKAILEKDLSYFLDLFEAGEINTIVSDLFGVPFEGMTVEEYTAWNQTWLATWKHPDLRKGYQELTYEPMIELVRFLQRNEFKVYVFTADEGAFVKLVTWGLYRIPPEQAQGSSIKLKYDGERVRARLIRTREAQYFDNWDAKPRLIHQTIGKRPIFAAGNSNGDLHMLQYTAKARGPSMSLLVHHTDGEREYAYDEHTDKVMPMAKSSGWVIVDMKNDWVTMFSPPF